MTQLRPGKYLQHPYALENDWITRNPYLKNGEEGYAIVSVNAITHIRKKVGPGYWNDLEYFDGVVWTDSNSVQNPIGDATGDISGYTPIEILDKMLNPYQAPVVSGVQNDGGTGLFASTKTIEIGNSVVAPVQVSYVLTNQQNLSGANPINVTANGRFTNEGFFPNTQPITLTHTGFDPTTPPPAKLDTITISVKATHNDGVSNIATTQLQFSPKIISAISQTKVLDGNAIMALPNKQFVVTRNFERDYSFGGAGHSVVCIPTMLSPTGLTFTDVTNPNLTLNYAMDDLGVMSINNDVGTYDYQVYASTYLLISPSVLRITQ